MSRTGGLILVGLMVVVLPLFPEACVAKGGQQYCTSSCGDISNISYPFRLKGDPRKCGHREFELVCEINNRTTFSMCGRKYYVLQQIFYDDSRVRLVDANLDKDSCSILNYSLTRRDFNCLDANHLGDLYSVPYGSATFLMNCTQPVNSSVYVVDVAPCNSNPSSPKTNFYPLYTDVVRLSDLPEHCSIQAQLFPALVSINITGGQLSILDIQKELLKGFDLSYHPYYKVPYKEIVRRMFNKYLEGLHYYLLSIQGYHNLIGVWDYYPITNWAVTIIIKGFILERTLLGILFLIAFSICKFRQRHLSVDNTIEEFLQSHNNFMPIRYSYSEIKEMTKGFKDKLGQGGYGSVYKGKLRSGHLVAVKVLGTSKANGQDFINEVITIGRIHHINVVRLTGFCVEGSRRALIYDFMANGSLDKFIFPKGEKINPLSWELTYEIGLGVTRGIEYLHRGCDMQILHFDIKPHNILLDENFIPKISDFGLAKLYPVDDSVVSLTAARGTLGYIAPELFYKNIGGVSYKADVYSFGMLLMEMVGKRKNMNALAEHSSQTYFPSWIYDRISQDEDIELGDAEEDEKEIAKKMIIVALWCIQMNPVARPSMSKVLGMLEGEVELLQIPPKPRLNPQEMSVLDHVDNNPVGAPISSYNDIGTITLDAR